MKKLITLMNALALGVITTIPVIACVTEQLDSILRTISNDDGQDNIWDLLSSILKPTNPPIDDQRPPQTQEITKADLTTPDNNLATNLAKKILERAESKDKILWYKNNLPIGTRCYNFSIDNGTFDTQNENKTWDVDIWTGRISITITYQVGTVSSDNTFSIIQKVQKTVKLKCGYTQNDFLVTDIADTIVQFPNHSVELDVEDKNKPSVGSAFTDFAIETKTAVKDGVRKAINKPITNNISVLIKSIDNEKVTEDSGILKLKITFIVSYWDSKIDMSLPSSYTSKPYEKTILKFNIIKVKNYYSLRS